ncbi:hypothetical protein evm_000728 [Chilo suppressalis]|nr:hypothetical protein evm_000728 [Chilo suppressalis]
MWKLTCFLAILTVVDATSPPPIDCPKPCPDKCKATCANPNQSSKCAENPKCDCGDGNIWSSRTGKCIPISDCPQDCGCNGDQNAVIKYKPRACQSTCNKPNPGLCEKLGPIVACVCKPGFILSKKGKCIKPDSCPGGNPCCGNQTFVNCAFDCGPSDFCPKDDSREIAVCDAPMDCPPGCACKYGYIRISPENRKCIKPQECPPVKCTRCNEIWDPCPSPCFSDSCEDVKNPNPVCETLVEPVCRPQCVCAPGYGRDDNGKCIPICDCPCVQ